MKAFTDIPQSKKLKEYLPLESADMYYDVDSYGVRTTPEVLNTSVVRKKDIPCWSLAALFSMLPKSARLERGGATELYKASLPVELELSDWYINPVDACVELIETLHEQELL